MSEAAWLLALNGQLQLLRSDLALLQAKQKERGAWVRPDLSEQTKEFVTGLTGSFDALRNDIARSLMGRPDDIISGRLHQAKRLPPDPTEIQTACAEFGCDDEEANALVDRSRLAAILLLLLRWRRRQEALASEGIQIAYQQGRARAISEAGLSRPPADHLKLDRTVLARYQGDLDRLQSGLEEGTKRASGLQSILITVATVGLALALVKRLFDRERYRVELFGESLVWTSWSEGHRAGAVESAQERAMEAGISLGPETKATDLPDDLKALLVPYVWSGPQDERTCASCLDQFGESVFALSLDELPDPQAICQYGRGCRHAWLPVEGSEEETG